MKKIDLKSMSIEELWALHEDISSILSAKLQAEKLKLEKRLEQIEGKASDEAGSAVHIPRFTRDFETRNPHIRLGLVAVSSRIGPTNCWLRGERGRFAESSLNRLGLIVGRPTLELFSTHKRLGDIRSMLWLVYST